MCQLFPAEVIQTECNADNVATLKLVFEEPIHSEINFLRMYFFYTLKLLFKEIAFRG